MSVHHYQPIPVWKLFIFLRLQSRHTNDNVMFFTAKTDPHRPFRMKQLFSEVHVETKRANLQKTQVGWWTGIVSGMQTGQFICYYLLNLPVLHPFHIIQCRKCLNTVQIMVDKPFLACYSGWDQWSIKLREPYHSVMKEQEKKASKKAKLCTSMCVLFLIQLYSMSGLQPDINHQLRHRMRSTTSHWTALNRGR